MSLRPSSSLVLTVILPSSSARCHNIALYRFILPSLFSSFILKHDRLSSSLSFSPSLPFCASLFLWQSPFHLSPFSYFISSLLPSPYFHIRLPSIHSVLPIYLLHLRCSFSSFSLSPHLSCSFSLRCSFSATYTTFRYNGAGSSSIRCTVSCYETVRKFCLPPLSD